MRVSLARAKALQPRERDLLRRVLTLLRRAPLKAGADRRAYEVEIRAQLDRLDLLAKAIRDAPSLYGEQRIGPRRRDIRSLIATLSQSTVFDFEMHMPLRALIGRTMLMAKVNFFRMLEHLLSDAIESRPAVGSLAGQVQRTVCTSIYTKIAEEILTAVACDGDLDPQARQKAVAMLCRVWEDRLTYEVSDFFPMLTSVWEARRRARVVFGTLMGTAELFELIRAGCDSRFIDLFSHDQITPDQRLAFQEFLFLASGLELDRLMDHLRQTRSSLGPDQAAELLDCTPQRFDLSSEAAQKMYESYRRRSLAAMARRYRAESGASRTAEEYIMLHLLAQTDLESLIGDPVEK